jgi:hypothetical protein
VKLQANASGPLAEALAEFDKRLAALEGTRTTGGGGRGGRGGAPVPAGPPDTLWRVAEVLSGLMNSMQAADVVPTTNTLNAVTSATAAASRVMSRWAAFRTMDIPELNAKLKAAGLPVLELH